MSSLTKLAGALIVLAGVIWGGSGARGAPYIAARDSYQIFIIGDSLAGGLWAGMARMTRGDPQLRVTGRYKEDSGLARPEIYDWPEAVRKILQQQEVDIAVIMLGSNDGQDMRTPGGRLGFGTPEWLAAYETEITSLLEPLKQRKTSVYWVGLPPMAAPDNEREARIVDEKQAAVLKSRGVRRIDIRPAFAGQDGNYSDSGLDVDGRFVRLRSRNGVNFLRSGNDKLAKLVLEALRADIDAAGAPVPAEAASVDSAGQSIDPLLPMFGKGLVSGEAETLKADSLPPVGAVAVHRDEGSPSNREGVERPAAAPESSAAALYGQGRWPAVKPGRIDDFSWPREAAKP